MPAMFFFEGVCLGVLCSDELRDPWLDPGWEGARELEREFLSDE